MNYEDMFPQVLEMEKFVLGSMLLKDGEIIPAVNDILKADDFYRPEHRIIFNAILKIYNANISPNILSLIEELKQENQLDKFDLQYLYSLIETAHTTAYTEYYARKIRDKALLRKLIKVSELNIKEAYESKGDVRDIFENAERRLFTVTSRERYSGFEHIKPILLRAFEKIRKAAENPGGITGVSTRFDDLDKVTNGFQKTDLILLAARPSMGKTAFALNIAMNAALEKNRVALFSVEMSKEQLGVRLLSSYSGINSQKLNTGTLESNDFNELINTLNYLSEGALFIDDTSGITIWDLRSKARKFKKTHGLDFIVIDYLQLMKGTGRDGMDSNRQQEIAEISRSLKALARELDVPILALSQLSRNVEGRADKRPFLSDLRESGSLEQDADIVMFLYREQYYAREDETSTASELVIAKNRNGPTTIIHLQFNRECMHFGSASTYEE